MTGRRRTDHRLAAALLSGILMCGLSGCLFHKRAKPQPIVLAPHTPVPLETPSAESKQPVLETPKAPLPPVPVATESPKPKRRHRRQPRPAAPAVSEQAPAGTAEGAANPPQEAAAGAAGLGALTPGGVGQSPAAQKEARDLLISTDRRLRALPATTQSKKKVEVSQIRNFWKQASDALQSGDAQGAKTLATKAKLLLDDLERAE